MLTRITNAVKHLKIGDKIELSTIDKNHDEIIDIEQKSLFYCYKTFRIIGKTEKSVIVEKTNNNYYLISRYLYGHEVYNGLFNYYYKEFICKNADEKITLTEFKEYISDKLYMWVK